MGSNSHWLNRAAAYTGHAERRAPLVAKTRDAPAVL
jgi:hypothetical protein